MSPDNENSIGVSSEARNKPPKIGDFFRGERSVLNKDKELPPHIDVYSFVVLSDSDEDGRVRIGVVGANRFTHFYQVKVDELAQLKLDEYILTRKSAPIGLHLMLQEIGIQLPEEPFEVKPFKPHRYMFE